MAMQQMENGETLAVLQLGDFGGRPDSGADAMPAMQRAIEAAAQIQGPVVLECASGRYDFFPAQATRKPYYISNTTSEVENQDVTKTIGLFMKGMREFTLDGKGSLFLYHGKQTMFLLDECEDIEIRNVNVDYEQPTVVEMTVAEAGSNYLVLAVHPSYRYEITENKLAWVADHWRFLEGPMQELDLKENRTWRIDNVLENAVKVEELEPRRLKVHLNHSPNQAVSNILQTRDGIRDQVGAFINRSCDVRFTNVGMHFMHGLGIVCQFSENLTFERMNMTPRKETGRTVTAFADFIHVSGCRGLIKVNDSQFSGGHDDPINVHGTYLRIVEQLAPNQVKVKFMHHQTYGFEAFFAGDEVEFVRGESLIAYHSSKVISAELVNPREMLLTLEHMVPEGIKYEDVIENVTWTPEMEITGNAFERVPTRGVLATTRRKVEIAHNRFEKMTMSAVFIAADAESWYESGRVQQVSIHDNTFIKCGNEQHPNIFIAPENRQVSPEHPVHSNIFIENNKFETENAIVLSAKSTCNIGIMNNEIVAVGDQNEFRALQDVVRFEACTDISLAGNSLIRET
ncbi:alpha-1,3-galactosidase-related protein [Paenibacillus luteus]|uniref:alpha-1,3-galactosidase-related protein n=1 Tax=Paenibacillus luteus TaxID=2545753 RepID=UPI00114189EF|nr:right-handed parallel beta-helix repeat-containing protein [Paenibacillus luteus]